MFMEIIFTKIFIVFVEVGILSLGKTAFFDKTPTKILTSERARFDRLVSSFPTTRAKLPGIASQLFCYLLAILTIALKIKVNIVCYSIAILNKVRYNFL